MRHFSFRRFCTNFIILYALLPTNLFAQQAKISGIVTDRETGKRLQYAQITVPGKKLGDTANHNGYFTLDVPAGEVILAVSMVGYAPDTVRIFVQIDERKRVDIALSPRPFNIGQITVEGSRDQPTGILDALVTARELQDLPKLGEEDAVRTIQSMPGVIAASDYSSRLFVRGSPADLTQIAFDGVSVYLPYHIGGIFGLFNSDGVERIEFSPAINQAKYGGWLAGRVNIVPRRGSEKKHNAKISLGLLSSKIAADGPFYKGAYAFALRRTYLDILSRSVGQEKESYYFYDLQGSYALNLSPKHALSFNVLYTRDVLQGILENDERSLVNLKQPSWGNRIASARWKYILDAHNLINIQLAQSDAFIMSSTPHINVNNLHRSRSLSMIWEHFSRKHELAIGMKADHQKYVYAWAFQEAYNIEGLVGSEPANIFFAGAPSNYRYRARGLLAHGFLQDRIRFSPLISLLIGLRTTWSEFTKNAVFIPRLNLQYRVRENLAFSFGAGRHIQNEYTLESFALNNLFSSFLLYFPVEKGQQPLTNFTFTTGASLTLPAAGRLKGELYYKSMDNIPVPEERSYDILYTPIRAWGLDVYLEKKVGTTQFTASYSLASAVIHEKNRIYYAGYDRRHSLKIAATHKIFSGWNISWRWTFLSGLPYTPVIGRYVRLNFSNSSGKKITNDGAIFGKKNSARFPAYHRFDFSLYRYWTFRSLSFRFDMSVINAYNKKNPLLTTYNYSFQPPEIEEMSNLPLIPTLSVQLVYSRKK